MKPVPGFEGYFADAEGVIWSTAPGRHGRWSAPHSIKPHKDRNGYLRVTLRPGGRKKKGTVHALVALAYLGPRPSGFVIRHLNGRPGDNRPCNLAYGTQKQNKADELTHGTKVFGERSHRAKLTDAIVAEVKDLLASGMRNCEVSAETGVSQASISQIKANREWRHVPWPPNAKEINT